MPDLTAFTRRLASIDLVEMPDGTARGLIRRTEPDVLNAEGEEIDVAGNIRQVAEWTLSAAAHFEEEARELEGR